MQKKDALNKAEKAELSAFFVKKGMAKRQTKKSVKKRYCKKEGIMVFYT